MSLLYILPVVFGFIIMINIYVYIHDSNNQTVKDIDSFSEKLNICKKKIKDFIIKSNSERLHLKNSIFDIEETISNNQEIFLINLAMLKFPSSHNNIKINKINLNTINVNYYNFSVFLTTNLINGMSNLYDKYPIYNHLSSHISYENINKLNNSNDSNDFNILYKINSHEEICNFMNINFNKNSRFIYIKIDIINIDINKYLKTYKTIKTTFYIKKGIKDNDNKFVNFYKFLHNKNNDYEFKDNKKLTFYNDSDLYEINDFYNNKESLFLINDTLEYTHYTIDEYNNTYY